MATTITDISVPAPAFRLGQLLEEYPNIEIELERIVPLRDSIIPYFWVEDGDEEAIEATLREDPLTETVHKLTEAEERILFEMRWSPEIDGLIQPLIEYNAEILRAEGTATEWEFRLQFAEHDDLTAFRKAAKANGVPITLRRIYNPALPTEEGPLTPEQQDALITAQDQGYFEVPRQITQQELSDFIGISDQALSQRLRRGTSRLITEIIYGGQSSP